MRISKDKRDNHRQSLIRNDPQQFRSRENVAYLVENWPGHVHRIVHQSMQQCALGTESAFIAALATVLASRTTLGIVRCQLGVDLFVRQLRSTRVPLDLGEQPRKRVLLDRLRLDNLADEPADAPTTRFVLQRRSRLPRDLDFNLHGLIHIERIPRFLPGVTMTGR
jgi:hypothetical protein